MKFSDLLRMSGSNLLRRKLRTALTVLGVVIGTASIVVMISLGLGLQKSSLEQIEQYGLEPFIEHCKERFDDHQCKYLGKL